MIELEKELGEHFLRIHHSHLVNLRYIEELQNYKAILKDGTVLPVSRQKFTMLKGMVHTNKQGI